MTEISDRAKKAGASEDPAVCKHPEKKTYNYGTEHCPHCNASKGVDGRWRA